MDEKEALNIMEQVRLKASLPGEAHDLAKEAISVLSQAIEPIKERKSSGPINRTS